MKKILLTAFAVSAVALSTGCAMTPPQGTCFTQIKLPGQLVSNNKSSKTGKSTYVSWLAMFATGDASIEAAKKDGNITEVTSVDYEVTSEIPLGIKTVWTTIVHGN